MERTIKDVVDGLILQIKKYGAKEPTIHLYKDVCHSLINRCNRKESELYTSQIPVEFLTEAEKCFNNGIHGYEYHRFIKRTIRLLDSYARTGKPDYSRADSKKKYMPLREHQELINRILKENRFTNSVWCEMDTIMRHFFCFLEDDSIDVSNLDDSTLFRFIQVATETKSGTMYRVVRALRLISDYIKRHYITELKADFSMFQVRSAPVRIIAPFSHDEINKMMSSINAESSCGIRDRAILLLAFETGLRAIDIIKLRKSDIDWMNAEVHVIQSKTNESLMLPINGIVMNAVADYMLKVRPESDAHEIFLCSKAPYKPFGTSSSLDTIIEKYRAIAGVEKKPFRSFHSLRRSFATELSIAGVPLPTISQMLGHKSIRADQPYLSYDRSMISFCALDFDGIPIIDGIYASAFAQSSSTTLERGDD